MFGPPPPLSLVWSANPSRPLPFVSRNTGCGHGHVHTILPASGHTLQSISPPGQSLDRPAAACSVRHPKEPKKIPEGRRCATRAVDPRHWEFGTADPARSGSGVAGSRLSKFTGAWIFVEHSTTEPGTGEDAQHTGGPSFTKPRGGRWAWMGAWARGWVWFGLGWFSLVFGGTLVACLQQGFRPLVQC